MAHLAEELRLFKNRPGYGFHTLMGLFQKQPACGYFLMTWMLSVRPFYSPSQLRLGREALVLIFWAVLLLACPVPQASMHLLWVFQFLCVGSGPPCSPCYLTCVHRFFPTCLASVHLPFLSHVLCLCPSSESVSSSKTSMYWTRQVLLLVSCPYVHDNLYFHEPTASPLTRMPFLDFILISACWL